MVTDYCSSHTYRYKVIKKATTTQTGEAYRYCTRCGHKENSKTVAKISSAKLSGTSYTYNGKVKTPTVTIKDSKGNTLKKDTDYTVSYASGRKLPGTYTVTVTYKGRYSGTKKLTFTIKVKAASISSATAGSGKVTLKWSSVSNVTGYEVWYAKGDGSFKKAGTTTGTSYTKKSLTNGKTYKFKIRSYVTISGKKYYSAYSTVKSAKVK